ncbi:uncharacterized protein LAESUDRAFT_37643 [Laetiporus sulphureus 93-53]|uniref:Uncharacterized protein n=1 Tax=Laetiporus sulphureus 93-53 TaxID=1314785 RepID=A0A165IM87_9APHY|nr:uncharacterized protein LAESUDRAFT_37643 [Laetiporus sulphureus 93-53]KZT13274.1 hypothetical protein LAESUDRAFT_37643 [Laetiporus sulphureus 93-53]
MTTVRTHACLYYVLSSFSSCKEDHPAFFLIATTTSIVLPVCDVFLLPCRCVTHLLLRQISKVRNGRLRCMMPVGSSAWRLSKRSNNMRQSSTS